MGDRDKLADHLLAQTGILIDQDDLPEFGCQKCVSGHVYLQVQNDDTLRIVRLFFGDGMHSNLAGSK